MADVLGGLWHGASWTFLIWGALKDLAQLGPFWISACLVAGLVGVQLLRFRCAVWCTRRVSCSSCGLVRMAARRSSFELAADFAAEAGVKLLFLELPTPPQLEKMMPRGAVQGFRNFVTTVARRHGFRFVTLEELRLVLVAEDTRDGSHLGYRGAMKLTTAAAPFVAAELEKSSGQSGRRKTSTPM